jgi:ElaB/YqjD/DUF883 family membrane-anchored ribosome-binding protein
MDGIAETEKSNGGGRVRETFDHAVHSLKKANERSHSFIRERPVLSVLAAVGLGFALARVMRMFER